MARAWHLTSRPQGLPTHDNFELRDVELPPLEDGMVRIRNRWLSVDPYMRGRMNDVKSYVPPFQLGEPMDGQGERGGHDPGHHRLVDRQDILQHDRREFGVGTRR